jgi:EAL domain-containing protein (putative c-di-GMP-specific phosphodiesterase class I)/ActR/RegA family two-component response regulator/GGDEF domain-containing protein
MTPPQRLLILDDDPLSGQTIGNVASLAGYEVEVTDNHKDFFRILEDWPPDIIALDLVMPDMDGVEVIAELARRHCNAKIIITSGIGGRVLDAAGRTAADRGLHIAGMLPKPFAPATLRDLLAKCAPDATDDKHLEAPGYRGEQTTTRKLTSRELEQAITNHDLHVCYQPKVSCKTGMLSGFEALARWNHSVRGVITPDEFIPLAEANGLIDALTIEVMTQAMQWYRSFRAELGVTGLSHPGLPDPDKLTLSINISALSLSNTQIFDRLTLMCSEYDIEPGNVIFELTETSAMEDPVSSLELLTRLRLRGFRLSIDDFGTGYSSMVQLVKLPFSEIKVDKSFVITARESEESRAVIKSIVSLGMSLGLIITAEGIEDEETQVFLRNIGCTLAQGYLFARPLDGDQVMSWLTTRGADSEQRRLQALTTLSLLDTPAEERFDALVRLTKGLFKAPMAAFALVDSERLWFKSRMGVTNPAVLRASSFCNYTIEYNRVFVINDTLADKEFSRNRTVVNPPHIRFYAGCPVRTADGSIVGTLTLLDTQPRPFDERESAAFQQLARLVEQELQGNPEEALDATTKVFNHQRTEARVPEILALCEGLALPCTLHVFELLNLVPGAGNENNKKNLYLLATFARILTECYAEPDFIGRFDHGEFVLLLIGQDDKEEKMARWKLESAVRSHNQSAPPELEIQYRAGLAHTQPAGNYHFQSLLDEADLMMPPL